MRTLEQIKNDYDFIVSKLAEIEKSISFNQAMTFHLQNEIYEKWNNLSNDMFFNFITVMMDHAKLIRVVRCYADELLKLKDETAKRIDTIQKYNKQYNNASQQKDFLIRLFTQCESLSGELYALGGDVDEIMLNMMRLYLTEENVKQVFEATFRVRADIKAFCLPWIQYHQNNEKNPLLSALQTLSNQNVSEVRLTS